MTKEVLITPTISGPLCNYPSHKEKDMQKKYLRGVPGGDS